MSVPRPPIPWHPDPAEMVRNCPSCREDYSNTTPCDCVPLESGDDGLPEWYGNFCMSCNHPHPEGDCTPEEAL